MTALVLFVAAALTVIALILLVNVALFPRLRPTIPAAAPRVSVLVPARDEAAVIAASLSRLDAQDYPDFEIIVLDDNSADNTAAVARAVGGRVQVVAGAPLPDGWVGKNWACHQLAARATGDLLLFTDADVRWQPGALAAAVAASGASQADLFTVWPTQITVTWAERLTVPLMALVVLGYLPVWGVHHVRSAVFGAANGQCMLWRRDAYRRVGGHAAVRADVLEDVKLGRIVKRLDLRLRMADGAGQVSCRMYTGWPSVRRGFAKNIAAGFGGIVPLLLSTVFHIALFILPPVWLAVGLLRGPVGERLAFTGAVLFALGIAIRSLTAAFTRQRVADALLMPVSVALMTVIAAQAIYWHVRFGGVQWKGRTVRRHVAVKHGGEP